MINIFTYGSLMYDLVWSRVVAGTYERSEAVLQGYDRKGLQDEVYPVIVPSSPHSQIEGIIYRDVTSSDLARLDKFEGEYYLRKTELVILPDMAELSAEIYVLKEEYFSIISPKDWDPVHFSTTGIHYFMHQYMGNAKQ